ncbi:MAG: class I SAM-dependent methyltransferase [Alphaproteobacteria bacterium]|nr:class I SAM-dependent methyltransferase [Alphaproteobacteria bacterium]
MAIIALKQPFPHDMMPLPTHDEHAREDFIVNLKMHMADHVYPYDETVYEKKAKPKFVKEKGRAPANSDEVHRLMMAEPYTKFWSAIARNMQEMLWDNQGRIAEHELPRIQTYVKRASNSAKGTLKLDPNFKMPRYIDAVDIHAMPGGYQTTLSDEDVFVGAVYDRGAYYYTKGMAGRWGEGGAVATINLMRDMFPDFKPKRILDVGCAIGWTTTPWRDAFPDAEIHGIDVGGALLRYGHGRAEALGKAVHFHQMSGEDLKFEDNYFDLVFSGGVFHETSNTGARKMMKEMHRVLKPGGLTLHYDIPYGGEYGLHAQFMLNWDSYYNAEPFWRQWTAINRTEFLTTAGFDPSTIIDAWADRDHDGTFRLFPKPFDDIHPNPRGGIGRPQFFGAWKK